MRRKTTIALGLALGMILVVAALAAASCGGATTTTAAPTTTTAAPTTTTAPTTSTEASTTTTAAATATTVAPTTTAAPTTTTAAIDAAALFAQSCAGCHKSVPGGSAATVKKVIESGKESMPGFADKLSADQITALVGYVTSGGN